MEQSTRPRRHIAQVSSLDTAPPEDPRIQTDRARAKSPRRVTVFARLAGGLFISCVVLAGIVAFALASRPSSPAGSASTEKPAAAVGTLGRDSPSAATATPAPVASARPTPAVTATPSPAKSVPPGGISAETAIELAQKHVSADAVFQAVRAGTFDELDVPVGAGGRGPDYPTKPGRLVWGVRYSAVFTICPPDGSPCWSPRPGWTTVFLDYYTGEWLTSSAFSPPSSMAPPPIWATP